MKNLTGNASAFVTQRAPEGGEPRTAQNIEAALQDAADRSAYLQDRVNYLDPDRAGATRIRREVSVVALKASTNHSSRVVCYVDGVGIYQYDATSTAADASPFVIKPTDVGVNPGAWILSGFGALDVANGIPKLDGSAKLPDARLALLDSALRVPAVKLRNGIVDQRSALFAGPYSTTSTSYVGPSPGSIWLEFPAALQGDVLFGFINYRLGNSGADSSWFQVETAMGLTVEAVPNSEAGHPEPEISRQCFTFVKVVSAPGTNPLLILPRFKATGGTASISDIHISGLLLRP
jgi:hypothetical protein